MQEEKHIYSSSWIKRFQDKFDSLKKEAKTYFQFERKLKTSKPVSFEKPEVTPLPIPKPPAPISEVPLTITPMPPTSSKVAVSKKIEASPKSPERPKKKSAKKTSTLTKELEEKVLVIGLVLAIGFFIILGILLSNKNTS